MSEEDLTTTEDAFDIGLAKETLNGPIGVNKFNPIPADDLIVLLSSIELS